MLQRFSSTLRYNYEKQFKARKIRCFANTENARGFRMVHLGHQIIFIFGLKKWSVENDSAEYWNFSSDSQLTGSFFQIVISINIWSQLWPLNPPWFLTWLWELLFCLTQKIKASSASFLFVSSTVVFRQFLMAKISNDRHKLNVDSLSRSLDHC